MTDTATRQDRWDRLAADLAAAGIQGRIDRKPWQGTEYGRVVHGVSSSIWIAVPGKGGVSISDKYGRGGKWYGFSVTAEDREGIVVGRFGWAQPKRSVAVTEAQAALGRLS